jgi:sulfate permease, SulP family
MNAATSSDAGKAQIVPNLFAGAISGLMTVIGGISYATLIYSGSLAGHLQLGIAAALTCATIVGLVVALRSSSPYVIAGPDANISAVMALIAAAVASRISSSGSEAGLNASLWATMVACSLLAGVFLFFVGRFKLGHWIRYIPYPVVGGFLAGTGWILARGSIKVMCGTSLTLKTLGDLGQADRLWHWVPGAIFALVMLIVLRRFKHFLVMPSLLIASIIAAHVILLACGLSIKDATDKGWLLSAFPQDLFWQTYSSLSLPHIDLGALAAGGGNLAAMVIVAAIVILLNSASVELATRHDIDLDGELKASGIANIIAAPFGALTGCIALSRSIMNFKAGATSRLSGITSAVFCGAILLLAAPALTLFPKPVLGGLLLYLGLSLLVDWVVDGWSRLSRFDYFLVVGILVIVGLWGFLPGVGIGLVIACMLFAFNYSRIDVVKNALTGAVYHSNVERSFEEYRTLREKGEQTRILKLQGFIFFGTAYPLLVHVQELLARREGVAVRFLVFDFTAVSGLDSSSVLSFTKMKNAITTQGAVLILVGLRPKVRRLLAEGGCTAAEPGEGSACREFTDLDYAAGWCEEQILAENAAQSRAARTLTDHLAALFPKPELIPRLMNHLQRIDATPGQVLYTQGKTSEDLYFVESGKVTALLELPNERSRRRLRTMGAGTVVGEMGLYLGTARSATVVVEQAGTLYRLTAEAMARIEADDLELANALHRFFVRLLAGRLTHANEELAYFMS